MLIEKISRSNISQVNFKNLEFGRYYSDHMLYCRYKDNTWEEPIIKPFDKINFYPNTLVFHYGQAVFEGMKAYKDHNGKIILFRPEENWKRINKSAKRLQMPQISKEIFIEGIKALIKLDQAWVPSDYGQSLYIRPFMIATGNILMAAPSNEYLFLIICSPSGNYYEKPLKVKIEDKYSRAASGGIGFTKAAGNYAASFYPTYIAKNQGYDQILWTDSSTHSIIEESGTMNVFFYYKNKLLTPPITDSILEGITRKSIIELAHLKKIQVVEDSLTIKELIYALKHELIIEAFGCGTAVVTNFFHCIGYQGNNYYLPNLANQTRISIKLKELLLNIQHNLVQDYFNWNMEIK